MKIEKFSEKIDTVKFSELGDSWSHKGKEIVYNGTKQFDLKIGAKVEELLNSYGIGINSVDNGKWLKEQGLVLFDEKNFREYRVYLGTKQSEEDFIEELNYDRKIDYEKLSEEEQEKYDEEYANLPYDHSGENIEFSVFLPNKVSNINYAALCDASNYLKLIDESFPEMYKWVGENYLDDNVQGFKKYLNSKNIQITNNNIEFVNTINSRLRKDSKVFGVFREMIGEQKTRNLITDWLKII